MVSICCITYNHEKYIANAIESFLMQKTNFKFEILIHDDASTDKTTKIIKEYEKKYPNLIKPIYQIENQYSQGKKVSSNNYSRAKGKYIAICEGDDYWTDPHKLQIQFDYMENNLKCGLCFHSVDLLDNTTKKIVGRISPYTKSKIVSVEDVILGDGGFMGTNSIFCRTSLLRKLPKFYKMCKIGDYPLQILTSCNEYAYFIKETMSVYRINVENSWVTKTLKTQKRDIYLKKNISLYENLIEMLIEFNKYSENKHNDSVKKMIKKFDFRILCLKKDLKILKTDEYIDEYRNLPTLSKIRLNIRYYFPFIEKIYFYMKDRKR